MTQTGMLHSPPERPSNAQGALEVGNTPVLWQEDARNEQGGSGGERPSTAQGVLEVGNAALLQQEDARNQQGGLWGGTLQ